MFPSVTFDKPTDSRLANTILSAQAAKGCNARSMLLPYGDHLIRRKLGRMGTCAFYLSFFPAHVGVVICGSAEEQVGGVATSTVITMMTNAHRRGNGTIGQLIGKNMRSFSTLSLVHDDAVSVNCCAHPGPTAVGSRRFVNLGPETNVTRGPSHLHGTRTGTKAPAVVLSGYEDTTTVLTGCRICHASLLRYIECIVPRDGCHVN